MLAEAIDTFNLKRCTYAAEIVNPLLSKLRQTVTIFSSLYNVSVVFISKAPSLKSQRLQMGKIQAQNVNWFVTWRQDIVNPNNIQDDVKIWKYFTSVLAIAIPFCPVRYSCPKLSPNSIPARVISPLITEKRITPKPRYRNINWRLLFNIRIFTSIHLLSYIDRGLQRCSYSVIITFHLQHVFEWAITIFANLFIKLYNKLKVVSGPLWTKRRSILIQYPVSQFLIN